MEQIIFDIQECVVLKKTIYEFMCPNCKRLIIIEQVDENFFTYTYECPDCGAEMKIKPTE